MWFKRRESFGILSRVTFYSLNVFWVDGAYGALKIFLTYSHNPLSKKKLYDAFVQSL
jgi:hypothetical protein